MHLVSLAKQSVNVGNHRFGFGVGESIHTENSCKYSVEDFSALALAAGFRTDRVWKDGRGYFALFGLGAA